MIIVNEFRAHGMYIHQTFWVKLSCIIVLCSCAQRGGSDKAHHLQLYLWVCNINIAHLNCIPSAHINVVKLTIIIL